MKDKQDQVDQQVWKCLAPSAMSGKLEATPNPTSERAAPEVRFLLTSSTQRVFRRDRPGILTGCDVSAI